MYPMKKNRIDLHMERKRALVIMLFFAVLLSAINIIASITMKTDCAQLSSILRSNYSYSVFVQNPVLENEYYQFDAGISYMVSADSPTSLNAEILMQSINSKYTDLVDWNVEELSMDGVAITKGLAQKNNLTIGDKLYSKHIVDGTVHEYTVEQILPELITARVINGREYTRGMLIMGYDDRYINNISHRCVVFTRDSLDELALKAAGTPESIIYRSDEISVIVRKMIPYCLLFAMLAVIIMILQNRYLNSIVRHNFKRLVILGFGKNELNMAYNYITYSVGISSVLIAALSAIIFYVIVGLSYVELVVIIVLIVVEMATLFISIILSKRQLWG